MQNKKILIATGIFIPEIGGPASYAQSLAGQLSDLGHEVTVVTYSNVFSFSGDRQSPFRVVRVWKKLPWLLRHFIYALKVFFACRRHDVIYALNSVNAGPPVILGAKMFRKKFFVRIVGDRSWEGAVNGAKTSLLLDDFQKIKKRGWAGIVHKIQTWTAQRAERVIVPSEYLSRIVQGWGIDARRIDVVYNGVESDPVNDSKEDARKGIGITGNILLSSGRLVPWKGFRMLIKIMPQLLQINQFFRLVIVGEGPDRQALEVMIRNMGLDRKVVLVGRKSHEELKQYLTAADIFILNSGYEGFSHAILEAMTQSIPVIASAVGGNMEIIHQGENGFLVRYNDEFNLIEAVRTLWQMPELREKFIHAGKETAAHFNVSSMLEQTAHILFQ